MSSLGIVLPNRKLELKCISDGIIHHETNKQTKKKEERKKHRQQQQQNHAYFVVHSSKQSLITSKCIHFKTTEIHITTTYQSFPSFAQFGRFCCLTVRVRVGAGGRRASGQTATCPV